MPFLYMQTDFTHGELDPRSQARFDLEAYKKGAAQLRNVLVQTVGGIQRRFGTQFVAEIENAVSDQYRLFEFDYDDDNQYLLVFLDEEIQVYLDQTLITTFSSPYAGEDVTAIQVTQAFNLLILTHPNYAQYQLVRDVNDQTNWTLSAITFKNLPAYDFTRNYNSMTFQIQPVTIGDGSTLTSSAPVFTSENIGAYFIAVGDTSDVNDGFGRITAIGSGTEPVSTATLNITSAYNSAYETSGKLTGNNALLTEVAWSSTRGYPSACTFYQGRLYQANTNQLPDTIFASVSNDYTDYDVGVGNDADSIQVTLSSNSLTRIKYIVGDTSLQIFTARGEYSTPQLQDEALTPGNIAISKGSSNGIADVPPRVLDNATLYVVRGGKRVEMFHFDVSQGKYISEPISLLASHLINNPIDSEVRIGTNDDASHYYFLINEDGTLVTLQLINTEEVIAWTLSDTQTSQGPSKFKRICTVGDDLYFIVERTLQDGIHTYIERADFGLYTDCTVLRAYLTPTRDLIGLESLAGETVQLRNNGLVLDERVVASDGTITLPEDADPVVGTLEVGLAYTPIIQTLPLSLDSDIGPTGFSKKRINKVFVKYYNSLGIIVNGIEIPSNDFGNDLLDQAPEPQTGIYENTIMNGWDADQSITITQTQPLPMNVLGIGMTVELSDGF